MGLRVAKVVTYDPVTGTAGCGSAVLIDVKRDLDGNLFGTYLTARHVVEHDRAILVQHFGVDLRMPSFSKQVETVLLHPKFDAALVTVRGIPEAHARAVPLAARPTSPGQWILSAGFPACRGPVLQSGYVTGKAPFVDYGPTVLTCAWIMPGMSGGPVLNESGEVLGITVAIGSHDHEHLFLPVAALRTWIESQ